MLSNRRFVFGFAVPLALVWLGVGAYGWYDFGWAVGASLLAIPLFTAFLFWLLNAYIAWIGRGRTR